MLTPIELGYAQDGSNYEGVINFRYNGSNTGTVTSTIQETSSGVLSLTKGELELNDRTRINYGSIYTVEFSDIGKILVADNNGFGIPSDRPKLNTAIGKIIGIDTQNNRYKVLVK